MKMIRDFLEMIFWCIFGLANLGVFGGGIILSLILDDKEFLYVGIMGGVCLLGTMLKVAWLTFWEMREEYDEEDS